LKLDESASQIRNSKSQIGLAGCMVVSPIRDFEFRI
jgi:hypothetical protein